MLRWPRCLVAGSWTYPRRRQKRAAGLQEVHPLVVRRAQENPTGGDPRIPGALQVVGPSRWVHDSCLHLEGALPPAGARAAHRVADLAPKPTGVPSRAPTSSPRKVWTATSLVTLHALRARLGQSPQADSGLHAASQPLFMPQLARTLVFADHGPLVQHRVLICDRDARWSQAVRGHLDEAGLRVVPTRHRAPNANAHAGRFVRSIKGGVSRPAGAIRRAARPTGGRGVRRPL